MATAIVIVVSGAAAPVWPHPFSGSLYSFRCDGPGFQPCEMPAFLLTLHSFPSGASVNVDWRSVTGPPVIFMIAPWYNRSSVLVGAPVCHGIGDAGSCDLTAGSGNYLFSFEPSAGGNWTTFQVDYSGNYSAPLY